MQDLKLFDEVVFTYFVIDLVFSRDNYLLKMTN